MAGYGNRTAPDYTADSLTEEHSGTRLGLTDSHSAPTYGAGFGNKTSQPTISPSSSNEASTTPGDTEDGAQESFHFNTQERHGSAPYSNAHTYGSASTAGAGYGNKTGSFSQEGENKGDSKVGKVLHKIGGVLHSPHLTKKSGEDARAEDGQDPNAPTAN
ncbi:hypothetical protein SLS59_004425 [Nothophoma quercina]|uniref:Dehydrin n=1 Tax=Nothophoma quercina TaxID=749835 RepID=A0ABR3RGQ9_9PLEO